MSIFIHKDSRVVVQGVTGKEGAFWAKHMKDMGTQVVFGVTPGKEGQDVDGIPVYHSVRRGLKDHPADGAMLFHQGRRLRGPRRGHPQNLHHRGRYPAA